MSVSSYQNSQLKNQYSLIEEIAHSATHGIGALLSVIGITVLLVLGSLYGTNAHIISYSIYGLGLITLYTASTLYHAIPFQKAKKILKVCDHAAIFLLISGTYTPFLLINFKSPWREGLLVVIWSTALVGIILKFFFTGRFTKLSTLAYILMGHVILIAIKPALENIPSEGLIWIFIGGGFYTFGALFYLMKKIKYHHVLWHIFVLLGSISHYVAIYLSSRLVLP